MKKRINISLDSEIRNLANEVMKARKFSEFSSFLEQLIREEHERRQEAPLRGGELDALYEALLREVTSRRRGKRPPAA